MALLNWTDYPRFWLSALPPASEHYDMVILANDDDKLYRSDGSAWVPYSPQTSFGLVPPTAYLNEGVALVSEASSLNVVGVNLELTAAGNALTLTAEGPQILNAGNPLVPTPTSLNFTGTGITASAAGTAITITVEGNPIQLLNEGSLLTSNLTSLNFVGEGITAAASGGTGTITVPAIPPALAVSDEGTVLVPSASSLNFVGEAVTATSSGSQVTISISGSGTLGSAPPPVASISSSGTATSISRSDHTHAGVSSVNGATGAVTVDVPLPSSTTPAAIAAVGAAGASFDYARKDHVHEGVLSVNGSKGIVTLPIPAPSDLVPQPLGTAAAGVSTSYSRADHVHAPGTVGGALNYAALTSDITTTTTSAINVGLSFVPVADKTYIIEGQFLVRTANINSAPVVGITWSSGLTDGVYRFTQVTDTTVSETIFGTISAPVVSPILGLPSISQSYLAEFRATIVVGATPSGAVNVTLKREDSADVTMRRGSWLRWQEI